MKYIIAIVLSFALVTPVLADTSLTVCIGGHTVPLHDQATVDILVNNGVATAGACSVPFIPAPTHHHGHYNYPSRTFICIDGVCLPI